MEALIPLVAVVTLGLLALRFSADSRPTIDSDEHRLAATGMIWDAEYGTPWAKDNPQGSHLVWGPSLAAATKPEKASHPYPTLQALGAARGPGQPAFVTDPDAAFLDKRARHLIDQHWSERVWLTGLVDQARLDLVCDALERDRQDRRQATQPIDVIVVFEQPTPIVN